MPHLKCIQIFCYLIAIQSLNFSSAEFNKINDQLKKNGDRELPLKKDLMDYLETIETVTIYCSKNENETDINLAFGIFLTNVNLKRALKDKSGNLPDIIKKKLGNVIVKNEELLKKIKKVVKDDVHFMSGKYKQISNLFSNTSLWVDRVENLVNTVQKSCTLNQLDKVYPQWEYYLEDVDNVNQWMPSPKLSDSCLVYLSNNSINKEGSISRCPIADSCYQMLNEGTNFGYALCHRMLLLLMAHLGRDCTVFSPEKDKTLMSKYCSMGYGEAEYIAMNNYGNVDLMMEIICLCSMEGHAQFLLRNWLRQMVYFRLPCGCFGNKAVTRSKFLNLLRKRRPTFKRKYHNNALERCNSHTTALASGTFSVAIRYIIQEYY